ncbi:hypothetical protein MNBD_CHLOROFLEXI01-387 [hydrothermal vent metagenome]|uniref:N-acetyltransferase domain-containing protein n=1 Tax=hydrothermal vent metagenome TaxID=652676 RepID=A0A3B0UWX5_9ZZZZ
MRRFPAIWQTDRLQIEDSSLADTPQLMKIFNACSYVGKWDPTFQIEPEETFTELVTKSMKEGEENGRFQLQIIRQQASQQIIG